MTTAPVFSGAIVGLRHKFLRPNYFLAAPQTIHAPRTLSLPPATRMYGVSVTDSPAALGSGRGRAGGAAAHLVGRVVDSDVDDLVSHSARVQNVKRHSVFRICVGHRSNQQRKGRREASGTTSASKWNDIRCELTVDDNKDEMPCVGVHTCAIIRFCLN